MINMSTSCSLVTDEYIKMENLYLRQMGPFIGKRLQAGRERERERDKAQTTIKKSI